MSLAKFYTRAHAYDKGTTLDFHVPCNERIKGFTGIYDYYDTDKYINYDSVNSNYTMDVMDILVFDKTIIRGNSFGYLNIEERIAGYLGGCNK